MKRKGLWMALSALLVVQSMMPVTAVSEKAVSKNVVSENVLSENCMRSKIPEYTGYYEKEPYWEFGTSGNEQLEKSGETALPAAYDSRVYGYVTDVRNQEPYGTCWAFATLAAAESSLIKSGLATNSVDLSEYHLTYFSYSQNKDPLGNTDEDCYIPQETLEGKLNNGGNTIDAVEQLAKWCGPVNEETLPYSDAKKLTVPDSKLAFQSLFHLKNAFYADSSDLNMVKKLIYQYGGATAGYYSDPLYYKDYGSSSTYYLSGVTSANHAVCIVGWDDNFSKGNFKHTPSRDGAWLCKNSNKINDSYVWISYDTRIGAVAAMEFDSPQALSNNYQYDGCIDGTKKFSDIQAKENVEITSLMNVFEVKNSDKYLEKLEAVSIHVNGNQTYYITVYVNPIMNQNGQIVDAAYTTAPVEYHSGEFAGIRCVEMEEPIYLNKGDCFAVEVCGEDMKHYAMSVSTEYGCESMKKGESYAGVAVNGSTSYFDLAKSEYQATPRIKAFTNPTKIPCSTDLLMDEQQIVLTSGETFSIEASVVVPAGGLSGITFYSSNPAIASVAANGEVTAQKAGECVITAVCTYGTDSKACKVIVKDVMASSLEVENYVNLKEGEDYYLTPILDAKATNRTLEYVSANTDIATVQQDGQIHAIKKGETQVVVKTTDGSNLSAVCKVKVDAKNSVTEKIFLSAEEEVIWVGGNTRLMVTRYPSVVEDDRVEFIISNPGVVSLENGIAVGLAKGSADITVKALDSGVMASIRLTVLEGESQGNVQDNSKGKETQAQKSLIGQTFQQGKVKYKIITENTVAVIGGTKKTIKTLSVPNTVKYKETKYFVTEVSDKAFYNYKKLTTVKMGKNIEKIGKKAFYGCKKLKSVTLASTKIQKVGKKAFGKTQADLTIKVPKKKLSSYKKLFQNAGLGKKVKWKKK